MGRDTAGPATQAHGRPKSAQNGQGWSRRAAALAPSWRGQQCTQASSPRGASAKRSLPRQHGTRLGHRKAPVVSSQRAARRQQALVQSP